MPCLIALKKPVPQTQAATTDFEEKAFKTNLSCKAFETTMQYPF